MPRFTDSTALTSQNIGGTNYGFSATRIEDLGASEYTLGLVVVDVSGSTIGFRPDMEKALAEIVKACRKNPRADNMMLRVVLFDHNVQEFHGFKPLPSCNEADYKGCLGTGGGSTALYDAGYNAVKSATQYGKQLVAKDFDVNAVVFIITDGQDNASSATRKMLKEALEEGVKGECLESLNSILIGLGTGMDSYFKTIQTDCGITQYVNVAQADEKSLAKLGDFISRSVSSSSQALGTGGASQSLSF